MDVEMKNRKIRIFLNLQTEKFLEICPNRSTWYRDLLPCDIQHYIHESNVSPHLFLLPNLALSTSLMLSCSRILSIFPSVFRFTQPLISASPPGKISAS